MLGHAKVQYLDLAGAGQHDVFRLDITVHDAVAVRRHERFRALHGNGKELIQRKRLAQPLPQVLAFDVFQDQEYFAVLFENVVNRGHLGIAEAGRAFRFLQEAAAVE